jgi:hypothetical protein
VAEGTLAHYCWHCYARNAAPEGPCHACGQPIEAPSGVTYAEQLIWALGHPLPGRQMIAAQILGELVEQLAERPLRALVDTADPYLAAQALTSLLQIAGVQPNRELLATLAASGAPPVAAVARRALQTG